MKCALKIKRRLQFFLLLVFVATAACVKQQIQTNSSWNTEHKSVRVAFGGAIRTRLASRFQGTTRYLLRYVACSVVGRLLSTLLSISLMCASAKFWKILLASQKVFGQLLLVVLFSLLKDMNNEVCDVVYVHG